MKFEIKNRWAGSVQFAAEIECSESSSLSFKLGLALKWGFKEGANLKGADLEGAYLEGAYLEGANLKGANLKGAYLEGAYLEGAYLEGADLEGANLKGADLEGAYLKGAYLKGADLEGADLEGAYLEGANLKGAYLEGANLKGADLEGAYLEGAYLKGAYLEGAYLEGAYLKGADLEGVDIPTIVNIHQKVFAAASFSEDALDMGHWHKCETTHCRAGWVIHLAGEEGYKLEEQVGSTPLAAALIYQKSDPHLERVPDFYATNVLALKDMRKRAEVEKMKSDVEE